MRLVGVDGGADLVDVLAEGVGDHLVGARVGRLGQESDVPARRTGREVYDARVARMVSAGVLSAGEAPALGELGVLAGSDLHRAVGGLSVGAQRRLDLALVLAARPHVLILDEPTNHLSAALVDELTAALAATPAAVVVATHDRQLLRDTGSWPRLTLEA